MAWLTGATADVSLKVDTKKDAELLWVIWVSPETAVTAADAVHMSFTLSMGGLCTKMASTDDGGEGTINCLHQIKDNSVKV